MSNEFTLRKKDDFPGPAEAGDLADELVRARRQLRKLNFLFDIALDNMVDGLSVFDDDQRLIVCNKRYAEIYGLPESLTRRGTPFADIARHLGPHDQSDETAGQDTWIESHVSKLAHGETVSYDQYLKSGRNVHVTSHPLSDGGWVDVIDLVGERRKEEQSIEWLAHNDPLTEVGNPLYFGRELENALQQLEHGISFALQWVDIDRFAEINEKFGHAVGDAVLRGVAERLVKTVRKRDLVARLGGDEFAIIQAGVKTQAQAERLTKRLLGVFTEPFDVLGHKISVTASIGVVLAPAHGTSSLELMKNVYHALSEAKAAGRATHTVFEGGRGDVPNQQHGVG
jgi:diguanylate cyclase (GGDEF)-like protein